MSGAAWPYFGWIPTVSGWLSFSHAGSVATSHYVLKTFAFNNTLSDKVGISALVVHQKRNLSDRRLSTLPFLSLSRKGMRGHWEFFAFLKDEKTTKDCPSLCGRIWVLSSATKSADVPKIIEEISALKTLPSDTFTLLQSRLDRSCIEGKAAWYCVNVEVYRNGLCRIGNLARSDTSLILDAEKISLRVASTRLCAFEVHSFVKDIFHRHKYHAPDDDTIAPMVEITDSASDDTQLAEWSKKTTHYLHSSVINFSRNTLKIEALQDAKGILSYLDSFQKTHQPKGADPALNVSCLESSIKNSIDKEDFVRKDWRTLFAFITVMLLAPFAAVTGVLKGLVGDPVPNAIVSAYGLTCVCILLGGWYVYIRRAVPMGMGFSVVGRAHSLLLYWLVSYPHFRKPVAALFLLLFVGLAWKIIDLLT